MSKQKHRLEAYIDDPHIETIIEVRYRLNMRNNSEALRWILEHARPAIENALEQESAA